jgi:hypothetical protein
MLRVFRCWPSSRCVIRCGDGPEKQQNAEYLEYGREINDASSCFAFCIFSANRSYLNLRARMSIQGCSSRANV